MFSPKVLFIIPKGLVFSGPNTLLYDPNVLPLGMTVNKGLILYILICCDFLSEDIGYDIERPHKN